MDLFTTLPVSSALSLRPYQESAVQRALDALERRPILVAPTGSGKTVMGVEVVQRLGGQCLWLAHRQELIDQAADRLQQHGLSVGTIMAGREAKPDRPIQVASVQTLRRRPQAIQYVGLIVVDECHHATAASYREVLARHPAAPLLGLTATPYRLDGRGLGDLFGEIIVAAEVADLVKNGYLHAPRVYADQSPDLRGVRTIAGDYHLRMLSQRVNTHELRANIVETWHKRATGVRTVVFAVDVQHSRDLTAAFRRSGIEAEHLDGSTPKAERASILRRLAAGQVQVVCNCEILTEGWDLPALECCVIARPTASLNLHMQMLGRVMRAAAGKTGAIVLDHAGNSHVHGLVTRRLVFSLDGTVRVGESSPLGLRRCQACGLHYEQCEVACPDCGWAPDATAQRRPVEAPGELFPFDDTTFAYRASVWNAIEAERAFAGYKPGWSLYRFAERCGCKPFDPLHSYGDRQPGQPTVLFGSMFDADTADADTKRSVYEALVETASARSYSRGWASHKYKQLFGVWPVGFVSDVRRRAVARKLQRRLAMITAGAEGDYGSDDR